MLILFTFLPEIYLFTSICILFIFGIVYMYSSKLQFPNIYINITLLSIIVLVYTFFLFINNTIYTFDTNIVLKNQSNLLLELFFILLSIVILVIIPRYNYLYRIQSLEYIVLFLLSIGSILIFINLVNLIYIYLLLEIQSIVISILISANRNNRYSIESSIKYFILGSYSSLLFLFGTSILYGSTGLMTIYNLSIFFEYFDVIQNDVVTTSAKLALLLMLIGLLFKIYSAPFHFWLPEIYEGSPTSVLLYISSIQLIAMLYFFMKMYFYIFFDIISLKHLIITIISILTFSAGALGATFQSKIKQLISYSTITVNGFFLYSILQINMFILENNLMYIFLYIVLSVLLFISILNIFKNNSLISKVTDIYNMYNVNNTLSLVFIILTFTLTGLPPFILFISKLYWLKALIFEYVIGIAAIILCLLLSNFYYFRIIKNIYYSIDNDKGVTIFNGFLYEAIWILWMFICHTIYTLFYGNYIYVYLPLLLYPIVNAL